MTERRLTVQCWLLVFAAVTIGGQLAVGMRASNRSTITGDEPFYLLTTQSLVSDGDLDLRDEYADLEFLAFWPDEDLWVQMVPLADGSLLSPHEPGLSLLVAPAYAVGGLDAVRRFLVVVWAAAMATAAIVARRYGAPWSVSGLSAVAVGLGAPGLVYSSQIYPEGAAALAVALALLLLSSVRPRPVPLAVLLVALMWLGSRYGSLALVLGVVAVVQWRESRSAVSVLLVLTSAGAVHYLLWHAEVYGGLTAFGSNIQFAESDTVGLLQSHGQLTGRAHRLYASFLDTHFGMIRWLPLCVIGLWGLRGRRTALPAALVLAALLVAAFNAVTIMGWWFPGRLLVATFPAWVVLIALGWSRLPRLAAALSLWSVAIAAALAVAARTGQVRLAVDPWNIAAPLAPPWLFPDFRYWQPSTVAHSAAWLLALGVAWAMTARVVDSISSQVPHNVPATREVT